MNQATTTLTRADTGRVTHQDNLPNGARVVGPSAEVCPGEMWTDKGGMQAHTAPSPMTESDIAQAVAEYANAAKLAIQAGFDGIELHAANGYLIEQFLNANINLRTDGYGGSADARNRFAIEVAQACVAAIGADNVGIRISPHGVFNGTGAFEGVDFISGPKTFIYKEIKDLRHENGNWGG